MTEIAKIIINSSHHVSMQDSIPVLIFLKENFYSEPKILKVCYP